MTLGLPLDLQALLRGQAVEWERLEFKAGWNPLDVLHTLCAFANDFNNLGGGYLILGVAEQAGRPVLPPVGLMPDTLDAVQKELLNLGHSAIQPSYHPIAFPCTVDGKHILVLWAPGGQNRPYRARTALGRDAREFAWYIRRGSSTVRVRGADETELLGLAASVPFDDRINTQGTVEDLSRDLLVDYLREVHSDLAGQAEDLPLVDLGRQMQVISGPPEAPRPLNVGLMFFCREPWRFFPATQIDVVWFPDGPGGNRFTEKVFRGPLSRMVREALDYIHRNHVTETVIKRPDRPESTRIENLPFAAIEEAVVNAVYHRGYDVREPVEIRISPEELVVLSYPGPDRSLRLELLQSGRAVARRYRNRRIGEFLKELDLTEGRGTGIPKILRAMRDNGSPPPEFDVGEDHSYFMVRLTVHPAAQGELTANPPRDRESPMTGEVAGEVTGEVPPNVQRLLANMDGELGRAALQDRVGIQHQDHFRLAYLRPALDAGLIEMTSPNKPQSSKQRYRLTAAGRRWRALTSPVSSN